MITDAGYTLKVIKIRALDSGRTRDLQGLRCCCDGVTSSTSRRRLPMGPDCFANLLTPFATPDVAVVFGRQLPRPNASMAERFHACSTIRTPRKSPRSPISADAVSRRCFVPIPSRPMTGGGSYRSAGFLKICHRVRTLSRRLRLLRAGYRRTYCAKAMAVHSHHYTLRQELPALLGYRRVAGLRRGNAQRVRRRCQRRHLGPARPDALCPNGRRIWCCTRRVDTDSEQV